MLKAYTPEDINDASNFIKILDSVPAEKQGILRIMMECMLLGANMAQIDAGCKMLQHESIQNEARPSA